MKKLFFILLLLPNIAFSNDFEVIDGDTIKIIKNKPDLRDLPFSIRLLNIDTPETLKAKCSKEKELGNKAKKYVNNLINDPKNKITYKIEKWDKFGGRVLGYVFVNEKDLSQIMIDQGLARKYYGKKKSNWCN